MQLTRLSPVQYVPRVGPMMAGKLKKLNIYTVGDLLSHYPFRYDDFSKITPIRSLHPGLTVTILGTVKTMKTVITKTGKRFQQAIVYDDTAKIPVYWFNQPYLLSALAPETKLYLSGTVNFWGDTLSFSSPEYEIAIEGKTPISTARIVPVYPETAGVSSKWLRGKIHALLEDSSLYAFDPVPERIKDTYGLAPLSTSIREIHFPSSFEKETIARHRLAFDELFYMQLVSQFQKYQWRKSFHSRQVQLDEDSIQTYLQSLPFTVTDDQLTAIRMITTDIAKAVPMNRLLLGDVGSGKTVVGGIALFLSSLTGSASAIMAPTQILATQHFETLTRILSPFGIDVKLIQGGDKQKGPVIQQNNKIRHRKQETGNTSTVHDPSSQSSVVGHQSSTSQMGTVYVGTHALLSRRDTLPDLDIIVIDEQQRFGVKQRTVLRQKNSDGTIPHLLTMTATPIPRTIALTLYGNLDLSILNSMPLGRKPIKTWVIPKEKRDSAYEWIKKQIRDEHAQAFIVCPFIEESETNTSIKAATSEFVRLKESVFTDLKLLMLHGKLKAKEKDDILSQFKEGSADILVATPVVEVGIDIPGATIILIEASERFGLAQLHQLRGRVGRNDKQSYCLLFSETTKPETVARLKILELHHNGPAIADEDFRIRGPGDISGLRQHGLPSLALASLTDPVLLQETRHAVESILHDDPELDLFPLLKDAVVSRTISETSND